MTTISLHSDVSLPGRPRRVVSITMAVIALAALGVTLVAHRYYGTFIRGADAQMYYAQVRSLVVDGDLSYENEITHLTPQRSVFYTKAGELRVARTEDGTLINKYTFGWALVSLPAFGAAHLWQLATGGDTGGYAQTYDIAVALWHLTFVLLGLWVLAKAAASLVEARAAAVAAVATFFATNLVYYACVYPTMGHAASFAAVAIAVAQAVHLYKDPRSGRRWISAGAIAGLVVLLRPTDVVLLVAFVPAVMKAMRATTGRRWFAPLCLAAGVGAAIALQLIIWRISYGTWVVNSYGANGEGFAWASPKWLHILVSTHHGAWYYHPLLAAGLMGLIVAIASENESRHSLWLALLVAYLAHIYVHSCWHDWAFSHSFGHRMFVNSAPIVMLGLARLFDGASRFKRRAAHVAVAALVAWNLLLVVTFIKGNIPPVGPVSPGELMAAQVETVKSFAGVPSR